MPLLPFAVGLSSWALALLGDVDEADSRLREGEQLLERHALGGQTGTLGWFYAGLGRAALLLGRLEHARRLGDRALEFSPHQPGFAAHAQQLLGDVATHPDQFDARRGEAHYRQALALAEPRGMRPVVAHCHHGLGKLYRRVDKHEQAQEHVTTAATMYRDMGMAYGLTQVQAETRELRVVGRSEQATPSDAAETAAPGPVRSRAKGYGTRTSKPMRWPGRQPSA